MHQQHIQQSDDRKVGLVGKTMYPCNKRCDFFLELLCHPYFMALEDTTTIVVDVDQLSHKVLQP